MPSNIQFELCFTFQWSLILIEVLNWTRSVLESTNWLSTDPMQKTEGIFLMLFWNFRILEIHLHFILFPSSLNWVFPFIFLKVGDIIRFFFFLTVNKIIDKNILKYEKENGHQLLKQNIIFWSLIMVTLGVFIQVLK